MSKIFWGYPPPKIKQFIEEHYADPLKKPLTFTATGESSVRLTKIGSPADISLEYSFDKFKTDPIPYIIGTEIKLTDGRQVSMRAVSTNNIISSSLSDRYQFVMSGSIASSGNIQSLLDKTCQRMDVPAGCYYGMFYGCTSLTKAPALPATNLAVSCYYGMFSGCSALTQAPELPATTLTTECYYGMFQNCTSLKQAPELPATTLAVSCYQGMFEGCSALTTAPKILPATTLAGYCYRAMFHFCTSLKQAPELPATTLAGYCYQYMFHLCTSLTQAPELPATTLASYCYQYMFHGCTSLTQAPELPATTLTTECYYGMFANCSDLETASFPNLGKEIVASDVVKNQYTFVGAADDIQATCQDGILVINSTSI